MPNLKDIKRRISSVGNTQKITRAMKLVSAAKFAKASQAVLAARPYGFAFDEMVAKLAAMAASADVESELLRTVPEKKSLLIVMATDRGLCGGLNTNLFKASLGWLKQKRQEGVDVSVMLWGRRAILFGKNKLSGTAVVSAREKVLATPTYTLAEELTDDLVQRFRDQQFDRIYLSSVEFKSALSQTPRVAQLLPVAYKKDGDGNEALQNFIVEPGLATLLEGLLMRQVASQIYRGLLDAAASEHGARMAAMDSATNNAKEVRQDLTLQYNRARQAAITKELIEIISGAEAL